MRSFYFEFQAPHPEDPNVQLRFMIEAPYVPADQVRKGLIRQGRIKWREVRNG
jgi:hypothetical protein